MSGLGLHGASTRESGTTDRGAADPTAAPGVTEGEYKALLMTVPEAARELRIGATLAYELIASGEIPSIRLGRAVRVPRAALETMIAAHTRGMPTITVGRR